MTNSRYEKYYYVLNDWEQSFMKSIKGNPNLSRKQDEIKKRIDKKLKRYDEGYKVKSFKPKFVRGGLCNGK